MAITGPPRKRLWVHAHREFGERGQESESDAEREYLHSQRLAEAPHVQNDEVRRLAEEVKEDDERD